MALKKQKTKNGFTSEYWRVLEYHTNFNRNDAVIVLGLYKDKAMRDEDANAVVETAQFDLGEGFHSIQAGQDTLKNVKVSEIYKYLKSKAVEEAKKEEKDENLAFFADAIDA